VAVDVQQLRLCLHEIVQNDRLRQDMSYRSRARAERLFSFESVVKLYEDLWTGLCEVAQSIAQATPRKMFDRIPYFTYFKSHATQILSDDHRCFTTALGSEVRDEDLPSAVQSNFLATRLIDHRVAGFALSEMRSQAEHERGLSFGEVMLRLKSRFPQHHPDFLRRHLMCLLKHGFITCEPPNGYPL